MLSAAGKRLHAVLVGGVVFHQGDVVLSMVAVGDAEQIVGVAAGGQQADHIIGDHFDDIQLDAVAKTHGDQRDEDLLHPDGNIAAEPLQNGAADAGRRPDAGVYREQGQRAGGTELKAFPLGEIHSHPKTFTQKEVPIYVFFSRTCL